MAADKIIIEVESKASGVDPLIEKLNQVSDAEKKIAAEVKKTSDEFIKANNAEAKSTDEATKKTIALLTKINGLKGKNLKDGFLSGLSEGLQEQLEKSGNTFEQFIEKLKAEGDGEFMQGFTDGIDKELKKTGLTFDEFVGKIDKAEEVTKSLKAQLREMKALLASGDLDKGEFEKLSKEAGELEDKIGDVNDVVRALASDTAGLDAFTGAISGIAAGFQFVEGTAALFGAENENLQKTLVRLNAVMAIANSIEQIHNLTKAESIVRIKAQIVWEKLLQLAVNATGKSLIAVRAAMIKTGIGALVVGLGLLIAYLMDSNDEMEEMEKRIEANRKASEAYQKNREMAIALIKNERQQEEALAKLKRDNEIRDAEEIENVFARKQRLLLIEATYQKDLAKIEEDARKNRIQLSINEQKRNIDLLNAQGKDTFEERKAQIKTELDLYTAGSEEYKNKLNEITIIEIEQKKKASEEGKKYTIKTLNDQKASIEAQLLFAQEGSAEELKLQIDLINKTRDIELKGDTVTVNQRVLIMKQAEKEIGELRIAYLQDQLQRAAEIELAYVRAQVAAATEGSVERANVERDLLDAERYYREQDLRATIKDETELLAQLTLLNAEYQAKLVNIDKQRVSDEILRNSNIEKAQVDHQRKMLQLVVSSSVSTQKQKEDAQRAIQQIDMNAISDEMDLLKLQYDQGLILEADYQQQILELKNESIEKEAELKDKQMAKDLEKRKVFEEQVMQVTNEYIGLVSDLLSQARDTRLSAELASIDKARNAELDNKNLTEAGKARIEAKYAAQERAAKIEAFKKEKAQNLVLATINGAQAVLKGFATSGPPGALIAGALLAAQLIKIASAPIPEFRKGTKNAPPGFKWVGEEGPELINTKGGHAIIPNKDSMELVKKWGIPGRMEMPALPAQGPSIPILPEGARKYFSQKSESKTPAIDYDRFAKSISYEVGKELEKRPHSIINIDEHGLTTRFIKKGSVTKVKGNKIHHG